MTLLGLILVAATYQAQEPHPPIEVLKISDKLFVLGSGMKTGGNSAVFITENDGVVLVEHEERRVRTGHSWAHPESDRRAGNDDPQYPRPLRPLRCQHRVP